MWNEWAFQQTESVWREDWYWFPCNFKLWILQSDFYFIFWTVQLCGSFLIFRLFQNSRQDLWFIFKALTWKINRKKLLICFQSSKPPCHMGIWSCSAYPSSGDTTEKCGCRIVEYVALWEIIPKRGFSLGEKKQPKYICHLNTQTHCITLKGNTHTHTHCIDYIFSSTCWQPGLQFTSDHCSPWWCFKCLSTGVKLSDCPSARVPYISCTGIDV